MTLSPSRQLGFDGFCPPPKPQPGPQPRAETGHLPETMAEALPFFREAAGAPPRRHAGGEVAAAMALPRGGGTPGPALNDGEHGYLADDDAPGRVLERERPPRRGPCRCGGRRAVSSSR